MGVCVSPPAAMPALGIQTDGSLPATARRPGSAPAIRPPWRNRKVASDMRSRRGVRRKNGIRAHAPQPRMHTPGLAPGVPHRRPKPDDASRLSGLRELNISIPER